MLRETPLLSGWTLTADGLTGEAAQPEQDAGFSLPGALELREFAGLLGLENEEEATGEAPRGMAFALPGMLPQAAQGRAFLSREVDFGRLSGEHAVLEIDHLCGTGSILLGEKKLMDFIGGARAAIDLTDALRLGRKQTLFICFDDAQEAGVCGAVMLRTRQYARINTIDLTPDEARQTLQVSVRIAAEREGVYAVRAALAGTTEETDAPWRESCVRIGPAAEETLRFALSMRAPRFEAGKPYRPPVLKLSLYMHEGGGRRGALLDSRTVMTGYPGEAPKTFVPLTREECALAPDALIEYAKKLNVCALYVPAAASDLLYRRAALEGIALLSYAPEASAPIQSPCAFPVGKPYGFDAVSPAAACWQLCGMPSMPPAVDAQALDHELLLDAAGRAVDAGEPETAARMRELRALQLRLRAEAARQGQYVGALCAPGEWREPMVADVLSSALEPLHLSVLPLRGAWWTGALFSASLQAFIPQEMKSGAYSAEASLLDEQGTQIAFLRRDCGADSGPLGIIEGRLPDRACVLTLRTRLLRSGAVVQAQEIPVYVGERGPLEAAFA